MRKKEKMPKALTRHVSAAMEDSMVGKRNENRNHKKVPLDINGEVHQKQKLWSSFEEVTLQASEKAWLLNNGEVGIEDGGKKMGEV